MVNSRCFGCRMATKCREITGNASAANVLRDESRNTLTESGSVSPKPVFAVIGS